MVSNSQKEALEDLTKLAKTGRQSILISGPSGCGKTYLSKRYADMIQAEDFINVAPKVAEIREALDGCIQLRSKILLCIENLDKGVASASYTLLKSLEEPLPNVYIVITCNGVDSVPDTIISRSAVVSVGPPTVHDINTYGQNKDFNKFNIVKDRLVWRCTRSFTDAEEVLGMTLDEINYYDSLAEFKNTKDNVSNLSWKIGHYDSNKESNLELAIRCIMELFHTTFVTQCGLDCIRDLNRGRIAKHAIVAKFLFNIKYCE